MKRSFLYFLIIPFISTSVLGQGGEISFQAEVDRNTISLADSFTYTLTIEGSRDAEPVLPDIPDFTLRGSSRSTQFSLVNNETRVSKSIAYTLMPLKVGTFTIPSARMVINGKTYTTRPVSVKVIKGPTPPVSKTASPGKRGSNTTQASTAQPASGQTQPLFIRTGVNKKEAFVNEQITLTFNLFSRGLRITNLNYSPPPTIGFAEEGLGEQRNFQRVVEGVRYNVIELTKAIFPISSGEVKIGPAELKGDIIVSRQPRRGGFFDDFFADPFGERKPFALRSDPISLTIKPLPQEGRPDNFSGEVGDYRFDTSASPKTVKIGDPITVTMKITGNGNLDTVSLPEITCGADFKTYAPEVGTKRKVSGGKVGGEKIFKQVIIPLSVEAKEIPAVSFSYFNPKTEKYRTITKKPIAIKVEIAPDQGPVALIEGTGPGRERIKFLGKDILYIKDNPGHMTRAGQFYYQRTDYRVIPIAALAALLTLWVVQSRKDRLRSDRTYARQVGASRTARKRFKKARAILKSGDGESFYGEVHRAFNRYLGDKFGLPSGAISVEVVSKKLTDSGAGAEIIDEVTACFSAFDLARFAQSESGSEEMSALLTRAEKLTGQLEKIKIK